MLATARSCTSVSSLFSICTKRITLAGGSTFPSCFAYFLVKATSSSCSANQSFRIFFAASLTPEELTAVQQQVRARVLRWFARAGPLDPADARGMAGWHHGGGFSLDASVRIEGADRAGLERLLRYCARPPFALERLEQLGHDQLVYRFPKPQPDGRTELRLTPLELLERLAALIPPPRLHRHRYHGVLAPNAPQRAQVTALAQPTTPLSPAPLPDGNPAQHAERSPARILWALLLARIYEILPLRCMLCGGQMRIIAFVTDAPALSSILTHLGEPTSPPEVAPARGPPLWDPAPEPLANWDDAPAPVPSVSSSTSA